MIAVFFDSQCMLVLITNRKWHTPHYAAISATAELSSSLPGHNYIVFKCVQLDCLASCTSTTWEGVVVINRVTMTRKTGDHAPCFQTVWASTRRDVLVVVVVLVAVVGGGQASTSHDVFASSEHLRQLADSERLLVSAVRRYVDDERQRLRGIVRCDHRRQHVAGLEQPWRGYGKNSVYDKLRNFAHVLKYLTVSAQSQGAIFRRYFTAKDDILSRKHPQRLLLLIFMEGLAALHVT